ncbi:hypothetical protein [Pseudomonas sp. NPDC096950]|uniref:hypothetical protein n=1 Tax=Pseudomonas sp. NPDC096950 TaxID=3364485 RepID=UPI00383AEE3C
MKETSKRDNRFSWLDNSALWCLGLIVVLVVLFVNGEALFGKKPPRQVQVVGTSFNQDGSITVEGLTTDADGKAVKCTYIMVVQKPISEEGLTLTGMDYKCVDKAMSTASSDADHAGK